MKHYFDFHLTGKKLFPIWLLLLFLVGIPYVILLIALKSSQLEMVSKLFFPILLLLIIVYYLICYFILKLSIENVAFKDKTVVFNGTFRTYVGKILLGTLFTIITSGIYGAWFLRDIYRFFINNSTLYSNRFTFKGKGGKLLVIFVLTLIVPLIIVTFSLIKYMDGMPIHNSFATIIQQFVMLIIMIPYIYTFYKWMVDVDYKDYHISWNTKFWNSCGKILIEMLLTIITVGIYAPLAWVRLYNYFADRTIATSPDRQYKFGYDIDQKNDFLFIWGQLLLAIITIGIYYPWALCKVGKRLLSKTYLQEI